MGIIGCSNGFFYIIINIRKCGIHIYKRYFYIYFHAFYCDTAFNKFDNYHIYIKTQIKLKMIFLYILRLIETRKRKNHVSGFVASGIGGYGSFLPMCILLYPLPIPIHYSFTPSLSIHVTPQFPLLSVCMPD